METQHGVDREEDHTEVARSGGEGAQTAESLIKSQIHRSHENQGKDTGDNAAPAKRSTLISFCHMAETRRNHRQSTPSFGLPARFVARALFPSRQDQTRPMTLVTQGWDAEAFPKQDTSGDEYC